MDNNKISISKKDIIDCPNVVCPECGGKLFERAIVLKKVPGLLLGQASASAVVPVPVLVCRKCGALSPDIMDDPEFKNILDGNTTRNESDSGKSATIIQLGPKQ